jgi:ferrochelatase
MPPYSPAPPYRHGTALRTGILLINLGTPEAPTPEAVRPYLRQFLSDPRVIEIPRPIWWPILHLFVLRTRPKATAGRYAQIWMREGSPLKVYTEKQAKLLAGYLGEAIRPPVVVDYAMRYGSPSIDTVIDRMAAQQVGRLLVLPLYPQYAASTTATAYDAVFDKVRTMRNPPELRLIKHFHDHPAYIEALAASVRRHWASSGRAEVLLMSFHGVPRFTLDGGDPYHCQCLKTGRLLAEALNLEPASFRVSFQSRFGRAEWLKPYTADTLVQLASEGRKSVDVICPGFISDCLETLEEISIEARDLFIGAGGEAFRFIPCLNDSEEWVRALCTIAGGHLQGWLEAPGDTALSMSRQRALAAGARD